MYPILITLAVGLLLFGLIFSIYKASRQAQVPKSEQSSNSTNSMSRVFWIYIFWALIAFGGALLYGIYRL